MVLCLLFIGRDSHICVQRRNVTVPQSSFTERTYPTFLHGGHWVHSTFLRPEGQLDWTCYRSGIMHCTVNTKCFWSCVHANMADVCVETWSHFGGNSDCIYRTGVCIRDYKLHHICAGDAVLRAVPVVKLMVPCNMFMNREFPWLVNNFWISEIIYLKKCQKSCNLNITEQRYGK